MAEYYHVQIAWLDGPPEASVLAAATEALRAEDGHAPTLGPNGYDGRWRSPIGVCDDSRTLATFLDKFAPCKVRMGREVISASDWYDRTAEEVCKASSWSYSRPLFRRFGLHLVAARAGTLTVRADDGAEVVVEVRAGDILQATLGKAHGAWRT